jgi:cytochrome o ubiquinol oxidase subunit 2
VLRPTSGPRRIAPLDRLGGREQDRLRSRFRHQATGEVHIVPSNRASVAAFALALPLAGCSGVLDPHGPVGQAERLILFDSLAIMLVIIVPVIAATLGFAWWFRAGNARAPYWPDWAFSGHLELIVWAIPALVITFLGGIAWFGSHDLDPFRPLAGKAKPVEIEVVSLDWKWLFIYPEEGVATINRLVVPTGTPLHFRLTASGVMNSFFVPQLGSQIYTMPAMVSQLHLQADHEGSYPGLSAQFSGAGFADMRFELAAVAPDAYAKWIADAKAAGGAALDAASYAELVKPSANVKPSTYPSVDPKLFDAIVDQTVPSAATGAGTPAEGKGG